MKSYGLFDILGPVMIGPSSSHTAGAVRLGKIGMQIADKGFNEVDFLLHGSFATTYKGHGSDKALVAGLLDMDPADPRIKESFELAKKAGIKYNFIPTDLGNVHPNTVKMVFKYDDKKPYYVTGSSIGGGSIIVTDINGVLVEFTGNSSTIILSYSDRKGVVHEVSTILINHGINIATMKVSRVDDIATMICELDVAMTDDVMDEIKSLQDINYIKLINPMVR
ncbi:MAG TPA: L-serine ammonia-lyase, iron-sulfur-dependent subunit beta [Tissierellaceae bacterium]